VVCWAILCSAIGYVSSYVIESYFEFLWSGGITLLKIKCFVMTKYLNIPQVLPTALLT